MPLKLISRAVLVAAALMLSAPRVNAQERVGNAALGALSGAVVLGPVGALAGAVVGYAAGPSISRAWGLRRSRTVARAAPPRRRAAGRTASAQPGKRTASATNLRAAKAIAPAPARPEPDRYGIPPAQSFE